MGTQEIEPDRIRILLVESDPADARLIAGMLSGSRTEYHIELVRTLTDAFARPEDDFDVALVDLGQPGGEGLDSLASCTERWPNRPILALSSDGDEFLAEEAVRLGAQDYLVKGDVNARAVRRATRYAFERHRTAEERRFLVRELEQSRKLEAIGQLAAGVAHEINTPTQYVGDNTRFLRDAVRDLGRAVGELRERAASGADLRAEELTQILEAADVDYLLSELPRAVDQSLQGLAHIARIVRAMKEFSHPALGEKTPTDLNHALETTILVASNEWKYVAEMVKEFDPALPAVECLAGEINQVFLNLLVNAAHAVKDAGEGDPAHKGRITVTTRVAEPGWVEVMIADTGTGIAAAHQSQIFDPFFTTKEVGRGTGQGLAIARNVVTKKHGGRIAFDTEVGAGTTFRVLLPVHTQPEPDDERSPESAAA